MENVIFKKYKVSLLDHNLLPARAARVCEALTPGPRNASFWFRQVPDRKRTGILGLAAMPAESRRPGRDRPQG
jgi:hypothetical protein